MMITLMMQNVLRRLAVDVLHQDKKDIMTLAKGLSAAQVEIDLGITQGKIPSPRKLPAIGLVSGSSTLAVAFASAFS